MLAMQLVFLTGSFLWSSGAASGSCAPGAAAFPDMDADGLKYAQLFSVEYHSTYKVVKYNPAVAMYNEAWHPDDSKKGQTPPDLVLYQCGTPKPTTSHNGVTETARFFQIPVQKIALPWTGVLHHVELLSASDTIDLIDLSYIGSPCAQLLESCEPGTHESIYSSTWKENAQDADVVFTDSFGTGWSNSSKDVEFMVSLDSGILHRAEWIKFMALFFNKEKQASDIFSRVESDYMAMQEEASKLKSENGGPKVVAWTRWSGCADVACDSVSAGSWVKKADGNYCQCGNTYFFYNAHFRRDVTENAGGRLLAMPQKAADNCSMTTNTDGSQTYKCDGTALEHVLTLLAGADVIVDETSVANYGPYTLDDFSNTFKLKDASVTLKAMTNEAVLRIDGDLSDPREDTGTVGSGWHEGMPAQPQRILSDMMKHMWGDAFKTNCDTTYLRHLHSGQTSTINKHTDCPAFSSTGDISCSAIHEQLHEVYQCAPESEDEAGGGNSLTLTMGLALGLATLGI